MTVRPALLSLLHAGLSPEKDVSDYKSKLLDPRWQRKRLEILQRDDFTCRLCKDEESTLHVHHLRYQRGADPWDYENQSLVTLCGACHEELHIAKFGETILESLIAGGADLGAIYGFTYALELDLLNGPYAASLPRERWEDVVGGLALILVAVRRGIHEDQIRAALESIP